MSDSSSQYRDRSVVNFRFPCDNPGGQGSFMGAKPMILLVYSGKMGKISDREIRLQRQIVGETRNPQARRIEKLGQILECRPSRHFAGLGLRMEETLDGAAIFKRQGVRQIHTRSPGRGSELDLKAGFPPDFDGHPG